MKDNLVIVESPAKAKTIEKFLGEDYKVMSSYGHIRDLKQRAFSIDTDTFAPQYEIPADKAKLVSDLRTQAHKAKTVWLASDEDREGEAISWHLSEVLGLKPENTKRIVFHEITKTAILDAIKHPRKIDLNLVNAQQARRVLDRIVGFKLSPILWYKVKPALSAGRVQSVAVRLIVEREREINNFSGSDYYRVTAQFQLPDGQEVQAELNHRFQTQAETEAFLESCKTAQFTIGDIQTKPMERVPAPPFTTSTLQQEAAHKLGFSVAQTMRVAQRLYESGHITYMRTDSVNLSSLCLNTSKAYITEQLGKQYVKTRRYKTNSKSAQEAHEAIRPTYIDRTSLEGTSQERRLYELIWKRTIASQMANAELEKTIATIDISGASYQFVVTGEEVKFDGFLRVYRESQEEEQEDLTQRTALPKMSVGSTLQRKEIVAAQRFAQRPARYNEASLVKKLEELGIGRPSTYATTITTIQNREYVVKGDKPGETLPYMVLTLKGDKIREAEKKITTGSERGKLIPTDTGIVVNDFLLKHFPQIMDYNFTADVEKSFDEIAEGKEEWTEEMHRFYDSFNPLVEQAMKEREEHRIGERMLGVEPNTGQPVSVKIGRFGAVAQIGKADDKIKPRFASLRNDQSIETITLEEALELFRLPRIVGQLNGKELTIGTGRFGPYIHYGDMYVSIPKDIDPLSIDEAQASELVKQKQEEEEKKVLKTFKEETELRVLAGRFGPYLQYKNQNFRLTKADQKRATELTLEECMAVINSQEEKPATKAEGRTRRSYTRRK
ncbi:MAG: type I DNA topoisomerase [Bacteroidaceae bacterium]|nr:type I DNA topoisomerase [Bacteroidaceae bacterium]